MALSIEANLRWVRDFITAEWRLLLPVALAFVALPPLLFVLVLPMRVTTMPQTVAEMQAIAAALPGWVGPLGLLLMAVTMVGALAILALALVPRISVREAIAIALRRLPVWLGAALLIGAVTFVAVIALGTALLLMGLPQPIVMALVLLTLLLAILFGILLLPVAADRREGPLGSIRLAWALFRRDAARVAGGCAAVWVVSWVTAFAIRVALGSLLLMAALAAGQAEVGQVLAALLAAVLGALQWAFFYVFVASLYRSRAGAIGGA